MRFLYNDVIALSLKNAVVDTFVENMKNNWLGIENGGILVGTLNPAANETVVTDITEPQEKDMQSTFSYYRAEYGHQQIMNSLWESSDRTKTYLGEWHTHNQDIPKPSIIDKRNWIKISQRDRNSSWLFFAIVGKKEIGVWTIHNGEIIKMIRNED